PTVGAKASAVVTAAAATASAARATSSSGLPGPAAHTAAASAPGTPMRTTVRLVARGTSRATSTTTHVPHEATVPTAWTPADRSSRPAPRAGPTASGSTSHTTRSTHVTRSEVERGGRSSAPTDVTAGDLPMGVAAGYSC